MANKEGFKMTNGVLTLEELDNLAKAHHPLAWGPWTFDAERFVLAFTRKPYDDREFDLDDCVDAAVVLDKVIQRSEKTWITPEDLGYLVLALRGIFRPMRWGSEINPQEVAARNGYTITSQHTA